MLEAREREGARREEQAAERASEAPVCGEFGPQRAAPRGAMESQRARGPGSHVPERRGAIRKRGHTELAVEGAGVPPTLCHTPAPCPVSS